MSADDATFLDTLSHVPNDVKRYSNDVADYVDKTLQKATDVLREALSSTPWLPEAARPRPPPPPRTFIRSAAPATMLSRAQDWVLRNKLLATAIIFSAGGLTYYSLKGASRKKRRARRAGNGARSEVVVIAGSPTEPLVRSIALDLERRGFIVFIVCHTAEEELLVQNESRQDVKPLMLDIVDPESANQAMEQFSSYLQTTHAAFPGAKAHHLNFKSLIVIPNLTYPSTPIATLHPSTFNDLINTRLLTPILTTQAFLPVLTSLPLPHQHRHPQSPSSKPSVLVLTPTIIPSLSPAFHAPESLLVSALSSFTQVLRGELAPLSLPVSHLQLGTFDTSSFSRHHTQTLQSQRAETLKWDAATRAAYGHNYVALSTGLGHSGKGSSLRELNNAVFDVMASGRGRTIRVGMGAGVYGFVGRWVPSSLVGWMMGVQRGVEVAHEANGMFGRLLMSAEGSGASSPVLRGSRESSPGGFGDSEYIVTD